MQHFGTASQLSQLSQLKEEKPSSERPRSPQSATADVSEGGLIDFSDPTCSLDLGHLKGPDLGTETVETADTVDSTMP